VLSLFIILPLLSLMVINLLPKELMKKIGTLMSLILPLAQMLVVVFIFLGILDIRPGPADHFFKFNLAIDNISLVMLFSIAIVILVTLLVERHLIPDADERFNFLNLVLITFTGMNGIVLVQDLFSLYVFLEITTVATFILISFHKKRDALEGAFKYIILSALATVGILSSIALIFLISGDTSFAVVHQALQNSRHAFLIDFALAIFLGSLFIKGGLVPFHGWLADAYSSAGRAISILLAGIVTKTLGVYTLIRLVSSVFGFDTEVKGVLMFIGALSIIIGAFAALGQHDFKRLLAYSSISQVGYIILSLGCGTPLGIAAAVFHLFNHAIFKSLLFVNSAALELQTGTRHMDKMGGLAQKMPITGVTSLLASLSTAGMPPLSGFWSKLLIVMALWFSGHFAYAIIAVLASVLTLGYMLSLQNRVFFGKLRPELENVKEASFGLLFPMIILAGIIVGVGALFPFILNSLIFPIIIK
jgi:multicomponent Na+:H+ antiporter subunit D